MHSLHSAVLISPTITPNLLTGFRYDDQAVDPTLSFFFWLDLNLDNLMLDEL